MKKFVKVALAAVMAVSVLGGVIYICNGKKE